MTQASVAQRAGPGDATANDLAELPFGTWLAAELAAQAMTPSRLARLSGLHRSTISRLLHAERQPTIETAARIAVALGSSRPHGGRERRADPVARVEHELAADPTLKPRDIRNVMTHYILQRAASRASLRT